MASTKTLRKKSVSCDEPLNNIHDMLDGTFLKFKFETLRRSIDLATSVYTNAYSKGSIDAPAGNELFDGIVREAERALKQAIAAKRQWKVFVILGE
jgi:hypothetical protein